MQLKEVLMNGDDRATEESKREDLAFYEAQFKGMLLANSSESIENDSLDHAIILIKCLIASARKSIKVFCHALRGDVWGKPDIVRAIDNALAAGISVQVAVQALPESREIWKKLANDEHSEVRMFPFGDHYSNFLLIDDKSFRFEPDPAQRKGFAYVKAPEQAQVLTTLFKRIWDLSQPLSLAVDG
jgi:MoaA/NifB/PqqE/SkfB family radical SAM enzyme